MVRRFASRLAHRTAAAAWRQWRLGVEKRRRLEAAFKRAAHRMTHVALGRACAKWYDLLLDGHRRDAIRRCERMIQRSRAPRAGGPCRGLPQSMRVHVHVRVHVHTYICMHMHMHVHMHLHVHAHVYVMCII